MSNVSSVSGSNQMIYASMNKPKGRPDPTQMAEDLFTKLDTNGQGYIDKSTLENALGSMKSGESDSASADAIFKALDTDGDSKITKQEMSDSIKKLAEGLESQVHQMRFGGAGQAGGMPPPPPPPEGGSDAGMSKDQLSEMAQSASESGNTKAAADLTSLVTSFDKADTDQDGKVSLQEAMAFKQSSQTESSSSSAESSAASVPDEAKILHRLMQLLHTYGSVASNGDSSESTNISVSA